MSTEPDFRVSSTLGEPLPAGSTITLRTASNSTIEYEVVQPFLPFTKSQVYLARPGAEEERRRLSTDIVLKIYDPRYLDDRLPPTPQQPIVYWSLEAETQAAERRKKVESGDAPDDFDDALLYEDSVEPWVYEENFYRLLKSSWTSEVKCLRKLECFQGTVVPKLFESGSVVLPPGTRALEPWAVVMEHIPGRTLERLTLDEVKSIPPTVFRTLLDAVSEFIGAGAIHTDINANNIIVSPPLAPSRAVLIDFGCGGVKDDYDTEEEWEFASKFSSDVQHLKITLKSKGVPIDEQLEN